MSPNDQMTRRNENAPYRHPGQYEMVEYEWNFIRAYRGTIFILGLLNILKKYIALMASTICISQRHTIIFSWNCMILSYANLNVHCHPIVAKTI